MKGPTHTSTPHAKLKPIGATTVSSTSAEPAPSAPPSSGY